MEDMAQYYGWSMDDFFWDEEPLTPEQREADERSIRQMSDDEMMGEMYAAQFD